MPAPSATVPDAALRRAVCAGDCAAAARALARGADAALLQRESASLELLHGIRQRYQRLPLPPYDGEPPADPTLTTLDRDGIVRLPGLVPPGLLRRLASELSGFVRRYRITRRLRRERSIHYDQKRLWHTEQRAWIANDAFQQLPSAIRLLREPAIVDMANWYLRKPAHLKRAYAMRYLPSGPMEIGPFHWHHDMEDKQLKAMVLLTDVDERGQYMTYVRGSHRTFHPYERFLANELDFPYCRSYLPEIDVAQATGRAGDVFLFDSNGMHCGNRSWSAVRDALFLEFTADRNEANVWGTERRRSSLAGHLDCQGELLAPFLRATPKWIRAARGPRRMRPTWVESLEDPLRWVRVRSPCFGESNHDAPRSGAAMSPGQAIWDRVRASRDHLGAPFEAHLEGTASVLHGWRMREPLVLAGRYHAVCGNPRGREAICAPDSPELLAEIGEDSARLVDLWSRVERECLSRAVHACQAGSESIPLVTADGEPLPVTRQEYLDLVHLCAANEVDMLSRHHSRGVREAVDGLRPVLCADAVARLAAYRSARPAGRFAALVRRVRSLLGRQEAGAYRGSEPGRTV